MIAREIYFNVPAWAIYLMYVLTAIATIIYARVAYQIISRWVKNKKDQISDKSQAVHKLVLYVIGQKSLFEDRRAGIMHTLILAGFTVLFIITLLVGLEADTPLHFLEGRFYTVFSLVADLFGVVLLAGLLLAFWRRMFDKPKYLSNNAMDLALLVLLIGIIISGFLLEGLRIAYSGQWESWSPIGSAASLLFTRISVETLTSVHFGLWLGHLFLAFALILLVPFTKLSHILAAPFNIVTSDYPGKVKDLPVLSDIEQRNYLGTRNAGDLTGKDLVEVYSCTSCGRCEEICPAVLTGKQLSPKNAIQNIRNELNKHGALDASSIDFWNCTTCGYCTEKCPVSINHQNIIRSLRTYTTTSGHLPSTAATALENLEYTGDPWGITPKQRAENREKLSGKKGASAPASFVYWPGCSINNDLRLRDIASSFVQVLKKAGVDYDVIDSDIGCCGDPARRLGEEGLYQKIVNDNILHLEKYAGFTLVTHCPHCYHMLKNEYPKLGLEMEVRHHSEVISELLQQGRLEVPEHNKKKVVYHDPCYLGRYNNIYEPVRSVIKSFSGFDCVEAGRNRDNALCCGGGGGQMWLEAQTGERVNYFRLEEIQQLEPDMIITACPYCYTMLENAISFKGLNQLEIKDIIEVFA